MQVIFDNARQIFDGIVGYVAQIVTQQPAKWDVLNGAMIFQTRTSVLTSIYLM